MMKFAAALAVLIGSGVIAAAQGFVGNTKGIEGQYRIFEFAEDGNPLRPVSGDGFAGVAWPSAVRIDDKVHVFAAALTDRGWTEIRRWTSNDGEPYVDDGVIFEASSSEPTGIGPATVTYDGSMFRLYYLVRGASGPGDTVAMASSADGLSFQRRGAVYQAGPEAPGGLSVSYACSDGGRSLLFLHAYAADYATAGSIVVEAADPEGPYVFQAVTLQPSGVIGTLTGQAGNAFAQITGLIPIGRPIVIDPADGDAAPYVADRTIGSTVYLDRPLDESVTGAPYAGILMRKADLSFVQRTTDGTWQGAATGYGQFSGVTSEYTVPALAGTVDGPWSIGSGYFIRPYFNSGKDSTENPEPIRTGIDCSAEAAPANP